MEPAICRDCEYPLPPRTAYWTNVMGERMNQPRCPRCHEDAVRRSVRGWIDRDSRDSVQGCSSQLM